MIKPNTAERVADVSDAAGSGAGLSTSFRGGMRTLAVALGSTALSAVTAPAEGSIVRDPFTTWDPVARQNGANYLIDGGALQNTGGGVLSLRIVVPGFSNPRNTSATFLGNYLNPATGQVQALGITALHNFADLDPFGNLTITGRTGPNNIFAPGQILTLQSRVVYKGASANNMSAPDAEFIWFNEAITGGRNAVIGSATGNLAFVGFGRGLSQGTPNTTSDQNVRAVFSPYDISGAASSYAADIYNQAICVPENSLPGLGRASSGDSGGTVFNISNGRTAGMIVAGTNGTNLNGVGIFLDFSTLSFQSEFQSVTIPSPGALGLLGLAGITASFRRRR